MRARLERHGYPRLQMSLLVAITAMAGVLASYLLLRAGLDAMWLRYPAALLIAYAVFLVLLWLWLRTSASDYRDSIDIPVGWGRGGQGAAPDAPGGEFGGGGASSRFADSSDSGAPMVELPTTLPDGLGSVAEADDLALPLVALAVLVALTLSLLFIVYSAPLLFAEILVDGVLAASLYRRLRGLGPRHWLESAIRRTFLPFALTAIVLAGAGWGLGLVAPEARTLGEVLAQRAVTRG